MKIYLIHVMQKSSDNFHLGLAHTFLISNQTNSYVIYDQKI